jgi:hypothetical protein
MKLSVPLPISCSTDQLSASPNLEQIRGGAMRALAEGVLRARQLSWLHRSAEAARVLDHIHNLPDLIWRPNVADALVFYNSYEPMFGKPPPSGAADGYEDVLLGCGYRGSMPR